ncbi:MAG: hypothetical protein HPY74_08745 [Firmicutes bacterium]|nr:hypothetical protein [Bacillota bacterium]
MLNEYIVAVDGGATKTDMVLCTLDGRVLKRIVGGSTNPNDIGFEKSVEYLRRMLLRLLENYGGFEIPLYSFYAGLSGGSVGNNKERYFSFFRNMLPNATFIYSGSDAINALNSGIGYKNGMVLIAGTGSVVFVRNNEKITQIGGWGYLLDDAGSGYDLGRRGFCAVLRDYDGRGANTILSELYSKRLGGPVYKFIPEIYQKGKQFIASFAPLIFEAEAKGDVVAGQILDTCAEELALLVKAGAKYLKESHHPHQPHHSHHPAILPYPVVLTGGLWNSGAVLKERFKSYLNNDFLLIQPELPPVYGAVVEAVMRAKREYDGFSEGELGKYAEGEIHDCFYENFKNSLKQIDILNQIDM